VAEGQRATRNLAKRQLTWIRSELQWRPVAGSAEAELASILQVIEGMTGP
jgi:tRNA A37 N6-isopentenylltransferase MiaA